MSILKRLFGGSEKAERPTPVQPEAIVDLSAGQGYHFPIVGESHYQANLARVWIALQGLREGAAEVEELTGIRDEANAALDWRGFGANLVLEPDNQHDPNAVAVVLPSAGKLGYLPREEAKVYQPLLLVLQKRGALRCNALLVGGTDEKPNYGVLLDLDPPIKLAHRFGLTV